MRVRATAASVVAVTFLVLLTGGCGASSTPEPTPAATGSAAPALPKAFPKDKVPIPQDLALATALTAEVNGRSTYIATFRAPGSNPDAIRGYIADLKNDGFKVKDGYAATVGDQGGVWVLTDNVWQLGVAGTVNPDATEVVLTVSREEKDN